MRAAGEVLAEDLAQKPVQLHAAALVVLGRAKVQPPVRVLRAAERQLSELTAPDLARLDTEERRLDERLGGLWEQRRTYRSWMDRHPEAADRLGHLTSEIDELDLAMDMGTQSHDPAAAMRDRWMELALSRTPDIGLDLGL